MILKHNYNSEIHPGTEEEHILSQNPSSLLIQQRSSKARALTKTIFMYIISHICVSKLSSESHLLLVAQENMNTEAAYMLTRQGMINASSVLPKIQALARRPDEGKEAGYSAKYQDEYENMSADIIEQLRQIYKWEIFLFDYPDTPFVDFPDA